MQSNLILGGNHVSNLEWCKDLISALKNNQKSFSYQNYKHRKTPDQNIDINYERKAIEKISKCKNQNYFVIAKSIGCYLALDCIEHNSLPIDTLVCIGLPIVFVKEVYGIDFFEKFKKLPVKNVYFINQDNDPQSNAQIIIQQLSEFGFKDQNHLYIYPGNTHTYDVFLIKDILSKWGLL